MLTIRDGSCGWQTLTISFKVSSTHIGRSFCFRVIKFGTYLLLALGLGFEKGGGGGGCSNVCGLSAHHLSILGPGNFLLLFFISSCITPR